MAETVTLEYIGPETSGIHHPVTGEPVARLTPFQVPADLGKALLAQTDNFRAPSAAKKGS